MHAKWSAAVLILMLCQKPVLAQDITNIEFVKRALRASFPQEATCTASPYPRCLIEKNQAAVSIRQVEFDSVELAWRWVKLDEEARSLSKIIDKFLIEIGFPDQLSKKCFLEGAAKYNERAKRDSGLEMLMDQHSWDETRAAVVFGVKHKLFCRMRQGSGNMYLEALVKINDRF